MALLTWASELCCQSSFSLYCVYLVRKANKRLVLGLMMLSEVSLSNPHTSVTALHVCVCLLLCWYVWTDPLTAIAFKHFTMIECPCQHILQVVNRENFTRVKTIARL